MFNPRPFRIPLESINFYVLAAMSQVQPRYGPLGSYDRSTSMGTLIISYTGHASMFCEPFLEDCRIKKGDYFKLEDIDSKFSHFLKWNLDLKEYKIKKIMGEYNTIKDTCFEFIKQDKILKIENIEKHLPLIKGVKEYVSKFKNGENIIKEWVV